MNSKIEVEYKEFIKSVQRFTSNADNDAESSRIVADLEKAKTFSTQHTRYNLYEHLLKSIKSIIEQDIRDINFKDIENATSLIYQLSYRLLYDEKHYLITSYAQIYRDMEAREPKIIISDFTSCFDELAAMHDTIYRMV